MSEFVAAAIMPFLPSLISGLVGIFSIFFYFQTKKRGFVIIGIGFLLLPVLAFVSLALFILLYRTYGTEIVASLGLLDWVNITFSVIPPILVLTGLILLRSEFK